jgi:hypothetical protein
MPIKRRSRLAAPAGVEQDNQYRFSRVGRHRLPLAEERSVPAPQRLHQSNPSQEACRPSNAHADPPRQRPQVRRAVAHRARIRRAEGSNGPLHHRHRSGETQNRARQPRLQHEALHLVGANCGGDIKGPQCTPAPKFRSYLSPTAFGSTFIGPSHIVSYIAPGCGRIHSLDGTGQYAGSSRPKCGTEVGSAQFSTLNP